MCLLVDGELDFRQTLRGGGSHSDLVALFERAIRHKPVGHQLRNGQFAENRTMSQIGG
jgi:molybdenum cofactor biosynthesis enzyme MoaA